MHRPVYVAHSLFIEGSHTTKNTASGLLFVTRDTASSSGTPITCFPLGLAPEAVFLVECDPSLNEL